MGIDRLTKLAQLAGALLAVPVGFAGSVSVYRNFFSDEVVCQNMRSAILTTIDKNVPAQAKLTLLRKDAEEFEQRCAKIDPDAAAIFRTTMQQLTSDATPAKAAPADARPPQQPTPSASAPINSATAQGQGSVADPRRFDGAWATTLSCSSSAGAEGYTWQFIAQVKDGVFHGQYGPEGKPASGTFDGKIQPDGSANILVKGLTGQSAYSVGRVAPGAAFTFHILARFNDTSGTGQRVELRPCDVTFAKTS
jgi:hypothetical protein